MVALKYKDPADGLYKLVPVGLNTSAADAKYVNATGDTMSGNLGMTDAALQLKDTVVANRNIEWLVANKLRWTIGKTNAAESGSNAGTAFSISAWDDTGVFLGTALSITRATQLITVKGEPTAVLGIATKSYVDGYTTTFGDGSALSYVITHNLNSRDLHVTVRQTATPYERIDCVVQFTTVNTVTIVLLTAPASGAYSVHISR